MKHLQARLVLLVFILGLSLAGKSQNWPREFNSAQGKIVVYQPQPQKLEGNRLSGVVAISLLQTGKKDPQFGALFFDSRLNVDRDSRKYTLESVAIPNLKFSGTPDGIDQEKIIASIIEEGKKWNIEGSMDELISTIEDYQSTQKMNENFINEPPEIIYTNKSSVLIMIDGEPKMQDIQNTSLQHVANTGYVILLDKSSRNFYLFGGEVWYASKDIRSGWQVTKNIPKDITKLMEQNKDAAKNSAKVDQKNNEQPPAIVVATKPSELIVTKGEPQWSKYDSVDIAIEYAKNSEDNLFRIGSTYYLLKSGRWFSSSSLPSGWKYLPADQLPKEFARIPSGAPKDIVLSSVPGTVEARDAILDAQVPQTATVNRKTGGKDEKVQYDGKPQFEHVEGTDLDLIQNADKTVFRTSAIRTGSAAGSAVHDDKLYYLVDNGVWYVSEGTDGPWRVSDTRPPSVDNIPPSSSAYNTKYVYVYDQTPDVVYVGYTPGYMGSYIYGPTVVYGTGYYYQPWYGSYYYPHHYTWGFNMNYNPWTGWSIGFGFTTGPFHFGFGYGGFMFGMGWGYGGPMWGGGYYGGWFGPPIYRPPCFNPYHPWYGYNRPGYGGGYGGGYHGGNRPINSPGGGNINWGGGNQINVGGDVNINIGNNSGNNITGGNNLYNKAKTRDNSISSGISGKDMSNVNMGNKGGNKQPGASNKVPDNKAGNPAANRPSTGNQGVSKPQTDIDKMYNRPSGDKSSRPNNVYADRDGNVYQRDNKTGNIQQNKGGNNWQKPTTTPSNDRMQQMNNNSYNRDRSTNRVNNYNQMSRPSTPSARPAGGGGGARKR